MRYCNAVRIVGLNDRKVVVFNALVGPFANQATLEGWLTKNGFDVKKVTSKRNDGGFLHTKLSRSPRAVKIWASIESVLAPDETEVNLSA